MTTLSPACATPVSIARPSHVRSGVSRSVWRALLDPHVNLAVWERRGGSPIIDDLDFDLVDDLAIRIAVVCLPDDTASILADAGYPSAVAARLGGDIAALGAGFADLLGADVLAIRLEVVETDACRKFHADHVVARLICTYAGAATQWLDNGAAAALQAGCEPSAPAIRQLATGDVALFKGRKWASDAPIVHRSPPIGGSGERRLVLVIDPAPPTGPRD